MNGFGELAGTVVPPGIAGWLECIAVLWLLVIALVVPWKGMAAGWRERRRLRLVRWEPQVPRARRGTRLKGREARDYARLVWSLRQDREMTARVARLLRPEKRMAAPGARRPPARKRRIAVRRRRPAGTRTGKR